MADVFWRWPESYLRRMDREEAPDFIVLQEDFTSSSAQLRNALDYPFKVRGPRTGLFQILPSGLTLLSRYPILQVRRMRFKACGKDDCLAAKGILAVQVHPPHMPEAFWLLTTHMQARKAYEEPRLEQIQEMQDFLREEVELGQKASDFRRRF